MYELFFFAFWLWCGAVAFLPIAITLWLLSRRKKLPKEGSTETLIRLRKDAE